MRQDEDFLPLTANPVLAESIVQGLPRASLDGRIDTTAVNLRLAGTTEPALQLECQLPFRRPRQPHPSGEFVYIGSDSQLAGRRRNLIAPALQPACTTTATSACRLAGNWRRPVHTYPGLRSNIAVPIAASPPANAPTKTAWNWASGATSAKD
jgi:hypothetical protein